MIPAPNFIRSRKTQRGLAATEMAITLPVLLLLMLGTAELGRAFYHYNTLTKSVRDGARYLSRVAIKGETGLIELTDEKKTRTRNLVVYSSIAGTGAPLLEGLGAGDINVEAVDATHIRVSTNYVYRPLFVRIPGFTGGSGVDTDFTINAIATMRAI
jgi:Flp pilus assembly protein TadG